MKPNDPLMSSFFSFNSIFDVVCLCVPLPDLRLVLVGRTGSGKSSSGNIILGTDAFSAGGAAAENAQCCLQMKKVFDWEVTVVDTPGLSEAPEVKTEISDMLAPEPHTFLLVIKVRTHIDEERDTVRQMEEIFGRNVWWHTIVVLTYDDQSETDVQMLNRTKTRLQKILPRSVKDRCYVLNNNRNSSNSQQVFDLLEAVATLVAPTRQQGRSSSYRRRFRLRGGNKSPSPTTLILGDSIIENVRVYQAEIHSIPGATVSMIQNKLQDLLPSLKPSIERVIIHVGAIDILRQQSEVTKADFRLLLRFLQPCGKTVFISGPIPTMKRDEDLFSRTLSLHEWLQSVCREQGLRYIKNFDLFWKRRCFFAENGFNLNRSGSEKLAANIERAIQSSARG
uniref:AIG1-type G domain-containing protein n=1 Tax=Stegastes partitus TaxID=144197 RepID=A0A3B5A5Z4_9TELE